VGTVLLPILYNPALSVLVDKFSSDTREVLKGLGLRFPDPYMAIKYFGSNRLLQIDPTTVSHQCVYIRLEYGSDNMSSDVASWIQKSTVEVIRLEMDITTALQAKEFAKLLLNNFESVSKCVCWVSGTDSDTILDESIICILADVIPQLTKVRELTIGFKQCRLAEESLLVLVNSISTNRSFHCLELYWPSCNENQVERIVHILSANPVITQLAVGIDSSQHFDCLAQYCTPTAHAKRILGMIHSFHSKKRTHY
jgi:hypothetical protein